MSLMNRARAMVWSVVLAAGCGLWACSESAEARQQLMKTERIASGLSLPLFVTNAPGEPYRLYIVEKGGIIKFLDLRNPAAGTTNFLDISALVANPTGVNDERGLLGMAFHPQYDTNGLLFVYYTNNSGSTQLSRFSRLAPGAGDPASEMRMLTIVQPQTNHNGGWMAFGPNDGFLYLATGDGGGGGMTTWATTLSSATGNPRARCSARSSASMSITTTSPPTPTGTTASPRAIPSCPRPPRASRPRSPKSGRGASVTPGATASIGTRATSTSPMSGRTSGRRSTSSPRRAPAARTTDGVASRATRRSTRRTAT